MRTITRWKTTVSTSQKLQYQTWQQQNQQQMQEQQQ